MFQSIRCVLQPCYAEYQIMFSTHYIQYSATKGKAMGYTAGLSSENTAICKQSDVPE